MSNAKADRIAAQMLRRIQTRYDRVPAYRDINWPPHMTSSRFQQTIAPQLARLGFTHVGDFEDTNPDVAPVLFRVVPIYRALVDAEGTTIATLRQVTAALPWRIVARVLGVSLEVVSFRSASAAGAVHATTTESAKSLPSMPASLECDFVPRRTSVDEMYGRHREAVARLPRPLRRFRTRDDVKDFALEVSARIRTYLHEIGWMTEEWIRSRIPSPALAEDVYRCVQRLAAEADNPAMLPLKSRVS